MGYHYICGYGEIGRRKGLMKIEIYIRNDISKGIKFGETFNMVIPSQVHQGRCRDQMVPILTCKDEDVGIVQTTNRNGNESYSGKKIPRVLTLVSVQI